MKINIFRRSVILPADEIESEGPGYTFWLDSNSGAALRNKCSVVGPIISINIRQEAESAFFESVVAGDLPIHLAGVDAKCFRSIVKGLKIIDAKTKILIREVTL